METEELVKSVELISKVGFPIVAAGLVILIVIELFRIFGKRNEADTKKIYELLDDMKTNYKNSVDQMQANANATISMIQAQNDMLVKQVIKGVTEHTIPAEENIRYSENDVIVNDYMRLIHEKTGCSRACVYSYHNGGVNAMGIPYPRMSMRYEYCAPHVKSIMNERNKIYRSFLSDWVHAIDSKADSAYDEQIVSIEDIDIISRDMPAFYQYCRSVGVQAIFGIAIRDRKKYPIGFIAVEYEDKTDVRLEQIDHCLHDKQLKIEAIMEMAEKRKEIEGV